MYRVLFECDDFVVVSKEAGILSIKARGSLSFSVSLFDILKQKYGTLYIVHRLDKDTSGIILFAKNKEAHKRFCSMFEKSEVEKKYLALVFGNMDSDSFKIEKPIKEFGSGRMGISEDGKNAITEFKVLERYDKYTLVEAKPVTGRRHQIRVHLYWCGNPVVGDKLYGDMEKQKNYKRMMLHSYFLSFIYQNKKYLFRDEECFLRDVFEMLKLV
jgi:RluA family pseudouridine synthase